MKTLNSKFLTLNSHDDWVRANCTNAAEVLSVGYPQWVDDQVGVGLENGLYKFTATFPDDLPEATGEIKS